MKCLREMNDRKESLKIKNQKSKCLFPRGRDIQHITSWGETNDTIICVIKMYC